MNKRPFAAAAQPSGIGIVFASGTLFVGSTAAAGAAASVVLAEFFGANEGGAVVENWSMIAYVIRMAGGVVRFASASSKQAAAELALSGPVSPRPPTDDPERPAGCFVKELADGDVEEPFWRAEEESDARPGAPAVDFH